MLAEIAPALRPGQLIVSLAAGITTAFIESHVPEGVAVVRVMPNTPALVDEGMAAISPGSHCDEAHLAEAEALLARSAGCCGSPSGSRTPSPRSPGSGPAYIFFVVESMIEAGVHLGLPRSTATELVIQTLVGSAKMLRETGTHPTVLREQVTSPGGTTAVGAARARDPQGARGVPRRDGGRARPVPCARRGVLTRSGRADGGSEQRQVVDQAADDRQPGHPHQPVDHRHGRPTGLPASAAGPRSWRRSTQNSTRPICSSQSSSGSSLRSGGRDLHVGAVDAPARRSPIAASRAGVDSSLNGDSGLPARRRSGRTCRRTRGTARPRRARPEQHAVEPRRRSRVARPAPGGGRRVLLLDPVVERLDQVLLGREVVVGVAQRDPGLAGDRPHRRALVATGPEQPHGGVHDGVAGLLSLGGRGAGSGTVVNVVAPRPSRGCGHGACRGRSAAARASGSQARVGQPLGQRRGAAVAHRHITQACSWVHTAPSSPTTVISSQGAGVVERREPAAGLCRARRHEVRAAPGAAGRPATPGTCRHSGQSVVVEDREPHRSRARGRRVGRGRHVALRRERGRAQATPRGCGGGWR